MSTATPSSRDAFNGFARGRRAVLGLAQLGCFFLARTTSAMPLISMPIRTRDLHDDEPEAEGSSLVALYVTSMALVLLGGAFAGLTIALMGQDNLHLQVLVNEGKENPTPAKMKLARNADKVIRLLAKGKHWVLVTLLLSNVIVNETLPVVLDRTLGGGVAAVIGSTVLIVVFGEILPQSICVRYGLPIGGFMATPVFMLMILMAPVAWPIAKLLDWVLGKHEGTIYKKSGLKTLVALHGTMGDARERLNTDEVTIIRAVLDLRAKPVGAVMTPMEDVFTLAADTVLNEEMMEHILTQGYSRIPIHKTGHKHDFVGMLLVKILITYDPEDAMRVSDFPLAALPETKRETSCLDILNYFQVGKSHMAIVSDFPGEDHGAVGIVTLEDVIEELIGEEIIDESDVYVDIHKAIRRITPAPKVRYNVLKDSSVDKDKAEGGGARGIGVDGLVGRASSISASSDIGAMATSPKTVTFMMRRSSTGGATGGSIVGIEGGGAEQLLGGANNSTNNGPIPIKARLDDIRQHLKHLGPSNPATNPRSAGSPSVTIKSVGAPPASGGGIPATIGGRQGAVVYLDIAPVREADGDDDDRVGEDTPLLLADVVSGGGGGGEGGNRRPKLSGKAGVQALRKSYGSVASSDAQHRLAKTTSREGEGRGVDGDGDGSRPSPPEIQVSTESAVMRKMASLASNSATQTSPQDEGVSPTAESPSPHSPTGNNSNSYNNNDNDRGSVGPTRSRNHTRSGSITESVVETGGIRKVVIMTSSGDEDDDGGDSPERTGDGRKGGRMEHVSEGEEDSDAGGRGGGGGSSNKAAKGKKSADGEEDDEEELLSPASPPSGGGSGHGGGSGSGGKKKSRRKKRKHKW